MQFLVSPDSQTVVYRANQDDLAVFNLFAASLTATPMGVAGDYNGNGVVDAADYTTWRDHLDQSITLTNEDPDTTPGEVTIEDYAFWQANFGATGGGGALSNVSVPEPASALIAATALLMVNWLWCRTSHSSGVAG